MKINILLSFVFLSIVGFASVEFITGFVGATQLNGEGCLCHSLTPGSSVNVWIDGPDTIAQGENVQYKIYLTGGPAVLGGFNVASRFGNVSPVDTSVVEIDNELTHHSPLAFPSVNDTISWIFNYSSSLQGWDTIYSAANSVNGNEIPTNDEWNFGVKFPVFVSPSVPVELISFTAVSKNNGIFLSWITATELNNSGFEIQKSIDESIFFTIGFVNGSGTKTTQNVYSFFELPQNSGQYSYRLKQLDFDGDFSYSNVIAVEFNPSSFHLSQNYPNPFNPSTIISFTIPEEGFLSLKIYNAQGELVEILSDGIISSGNHKIEWNTSSFTSGGSTKGGYASGIYFYKLDFESNAGLKLSKVKKMILAK